MMTSSEATRACSFLTCGAFSRFAFTRLAGGIRLFPRNPLAVAPLPAYAQSLLFELTNSRVDSAEKIGVRPLADQFVIVVRHRDLDIIQVPRVRKHDVGFRFAFGVIQELPDLAELRRQFSGLRRRQIHLPA